MRSVHFVNQKSIAIGRFSSAKCTVCRAIRRKILLFGRLRIVGQIDTQRLILPQIGLLQPCGGGRPAPVAVQYANRHIEPLAQNTGKIVGNRRKRLRSCRFGGKPSVPKAVVLEAVVLLAVKGILRHGVHAQMRIVCRSKRGLCLGVIAQEKLHVALPAGQPYFPDIHLFQRELPIRADKPKGLVFRSRKRGELGAKRAARRNRKCCQRRLTQENGNALCAVAFPPNGDRLAALQHHAALKNRG